MVKGISKLNENKVTEIGLTPQDWEVKKLGEVAKVIMGQSPASQYYNTDMKGLPLIQGNADIKKRKSIARVYTTQITKSCNIGDIIMTVRAPVGAVGKASRKSCLGRGVCSIDFENDYLYYYLLSIEDKWTQMSKGSTFDSINSKEVMELDILLPSDEKEQKAIAEVLTDTDNMILSLEKLLDKKKKIKQGTMQELLTGKKRLPGFSDDWTRYELGELLEYEQPTKYIVKSTDYTANGTPVLTPGKSFVLGYTNEEFGVYSKVPVIIFDDFTTVSKYVTFPFKVKSSAMKMLKLKNPTNSLRLIYEMMQILKFTKGDHKRYWISEFSKLKVNLPTTKEQKAIARVISDMDAEIVALEEKLEKYKEIKQGMMQELLTGRTRLI